MTEEDSNYNESAPHPSEEIKTEKTHHSIDDILNTRNQLDRIIKEKFTRDVSVMFTDICGYTKFTESRGDLASRAMLQRHNGIVIPVVTSKNGVVIKTIGDAVMAMFDNSSDAVAAAVEVQKGLALHNQQSGQSDAIHVKIGIHHGQVLMDESDIFGDAVNLAARIQSLAGSDEILLSQSVHDGACVSGRMDCAFLGAVQVKGKTDPQNIYRVLWSDEQKKKGALTQVRSGGTKGDSPAVEHSASPATSPTHAGSSVNAVPSIHIDISRVGERLTLSCFEQNAQQIGTVRVYEEVEFKSDHVSELCSVMVNTLNLVNRRGVFPSDCIDKLRQTGQELQIALLTHKIMMMLNTTEAEHLILLLDETLVYIPWELIHDGEQFLSRKFSMGRVIKTRQNVQNHQSRTIVHPFKMLIIANPEKNLDGADKEGDALENFLSSQHGRINISRPKEKITSEFVLNHLHYYDWVHFAGHAQYNVDNPAMNGWSLSDKVLHARDIMAIAQERPMPALVFSNACQSARSEAEKIETRSQDEIYSMANALLLSGVHHYIGTFWEIQDQYSLEFAMTCYHGILAGKTIGAAIRDARLAFVEAHGEDAIVWASYLLYGDPRFCYTERADLTHQSNDLSEKNGDTGTGKAAYSNIPESTKPEKNKRNFTVLAVCLGIVLLLLSGVSGYQWHLERKKAELNAKIAGYITQGKSDFQTGNPDGAKKYFEQVVQLADSSGKHKAEALMGLGRIASARGKADEALGFYERASQYALQSGGIQQTDSGTHQGNNTSQNNGAAGVSAQTQMAAQQAQVAQALVLTGQGRYQDALVLFNKVRVAGQDNLVPDSLIKDIEQRVSIATDQEKQKRIKELVASLLSDREKGKSEKTLSDKDKRNSENALSGRDEGDKSSTHSNDRFMNRPLTMWIMDFETTGYSLQEGQPQLLAAGLAGVLLDNSHVSLVERAMLDKVLEELNLGRSSLMSRDTALSIGKLMAARTMLSGQMVFTGGQIQVSLRLVETETGQIVLSVNRLFGGLVPVSIMADELGKELSQKLKSLYPLEKS